MVIENGFNANEYSSLLPAGTYKFRVDKIEPKQTSSGGVMLLITLLLMDGQYTLNHKVTDRVNWQCPTSQTAENIGRETFAKLVKACGKTNIYDTNELIGSEIAAKVEVIVSDPYGEQQVVKRYMPVNATTFSEIPKLKTPPKTQIKKEESVEEYGDIPF